MLDAMRAKVTHSINEQSKRRHTMYTILYPELEARLRAPQARTTAAQHALSEEPDQCSSVAGVRTMRAWEPVAPAHRGTALHASAATPDLELA